MEEIKVGDSVQIQSRDGFNGSIGKIDAIVPPPPWNPNSEWGVAYHVDFGMKQYGRHVVPFKRHEVVLVADKS